MSADVFNFDVSLWDVGKVINLNSMFKDTPQFDQKLCWDTSTVISDVDLFTNSKGSLDQFPQCNTAHPSDAPSKSPSAQPTALPSTSPSAKPSESPSASPSAKPSE